MYRFFLCIFNFIPAKIYHSNNTVIHISEGASIIEVNTEKDNLGKIFISKKTTLYTDGNDLTAQIVLIQSHKKISPPIEQQLAAIPKTKEIKSEKPAEPIQKSEYNLVPEKSDSKSQIRSANGNIAISNTNSNIKAILARYSNDNISKTVCKEPVISFIENENNDKNRVNYFSIRPPPAG